MENIKFPLNGKIIEVLEEGNLYSGWIKFLRDGKVIRKLNKPAPGPFPDPSSDRAAEELLDEALSFEGDLLADRILAGGADPEYDAIAALLPQPVSYDFIGTPESKWKYLIWPDGRIGIQTTFEHDYANEIYCAFHPQKEGFNYPTFSCRQTLLNGYLPINRSIFRPAGSLQTWEQMAFACADEKGRTLIHVRVFSEDMTEPIYFLIRPPETVAPAEMKALAYRPAKRMAGGRDFFRALFGVAEESERLLNGAMQLTLPEKRVGDGCRAAMLKAFNTCVGEAPHYGATRYFLDTGRNSESFPPTTTTLVNCCLEWNMFRRARKLLEYYLKNFVTRDGRLDHRGNGAAISEHGMVLDVFARYVRYTKDRRFLEKHRRKIQKICDFLLRARKEGRQQPPDSPEFGLIKGCPEDDVRSWEPAYWYSGNCWAWRGLLETGRIFTAKPLASSQSAAYGRKLLAESRRFRDDILRSMRDSVIKGSGLVFLPPYAGAGQVFDNMLAPVHYEGDPNRVFYLPAYANYRLYPEVLSSGIPDRALSETIIRYREKKGGELLGLTRINLPPQTGPALGLDKVDLLRPGETLLDDWPLYNYLWALANSGRARKFLLVFYSHMAYHQDRQTFFAPEHTDLTRLFPAHCIPAQLTVPLALKWMLVLECPDEPVLWLNRTAPRKWLENGKKIEVRNCATQWGAVSYRLEADPDKPEIRLEFEIDGVPPPEIRCCFRCPDSRKITRAACPEKLPVTLNIRQEFVSVSPGKRRKFALLVTTSGD